MRVETAVEDGEPRICPDGAFFVDLAPLSDPGLVESSIAQALQLSGSSGPTTLTRVVAALQRRRVLLILDNFEQILPAAPRVAELLARCPELTIVVTSRAPLHLYGEHEFAVLPLAVPPDAPGAGQPSPEQAPSDLAICGRYLFSPEIFPALRQTGQGALGEIQLTDAIARLSRAGRPVYGVRVQPGERRLDIGSPESYFEAFELLKGEESQ